MGQQHLLFRLLSCVLCCSGLACSVLRGQNDFYIDVRSWWLHAVKLPWIDVDSNSSIVWGAVLMLTATVFNSQGLIAVRFFLGVTEAAIAPGLSIVVSMWYKRSEQPFRHGIWFQGITIAGIFGGLVAYGIGHVQLIAPWKVRMVDVFLDTVPRHSRTSPFSPCMMF